MPAPDSIVKYWDQQITILSESLDILRQKPRKVPTHNLRVSIKKIRSYLRLWQEFTGEKWKSEFEQVKKLYRSVGKFRDLGMSQLILLRLQRKENITLRSFRKNLGSLCAISRRWLTQAANEFETGKTDLLFARVHESFSSLADEEIKNKINSLVEKSLEKVRDLMDHFRKNSHEIRKLLKDVYYWLKPYPRNPFFTADELKKLKKALDELGDRQDQFEFGKKLEHFRKEYLVKGSEEFTKAKEIEIIIEKNQEDFLADAEKKLKELLSKK